MNWRLLDLCRQNHMNGEIQIHHPETSQNNSTVCCCRPCATKVLRNTHRSKSVTKIYRGLRRTSYTVWTRYVIYLHVVIVLSVVANGQAFAQRKGLVPPQTVANIEFNVRAASLEMISPGAANGAAPTARFSIALTNRSKSSIGLVINSAASGASTDTALDLRTFNNSISHGLRICDPCRNVPDSLWIILQPDQTDNIVIGFYTRVAEPQRHRKAETADLTLILLVREGSGETTQAVLSFSDIPIRNAIQ